MTGALKPYPKYKESGVEWLGRVPEGWTHSPLKHSVREPLQYGAGELASSADETDPRYVRITDIADDGSLKTEEIRRLPWKSAQPYLLEDDDLLVARSGTVGRSLIYRSSMGVACFAGYLIRIRPDRNRLHPSFLWHVFHSQYFWDFIVQSQVNTTIANVNATRYGQLPLPLPPLPEQQAIADYLDAETQRIDTLIAELREMIRLLKEKRQALISHCVTKGLDPTVPMKDSGVEWLGEVPEGWEVSRLKHLVCISSGFAFDSRIFSDSGIPVVRMNNVNRGRVSLENAAKIPEKNCVPDAALAPEDIVYGLSGSIGETGSLGNFAVIDAVDLPAQLNQRLARFRTHSLDNCPSFVRYAIQCSSFYDQVLQMATGTAQFNVSPVDMGAIIVVRPEKREQQAIAAHLDRETAKIGRLISETEDTITLMQERRSALISSVVTGKLQVPGIAEPAGSTLNSRTENRS
jgi:type I restriction enzyme, S subunit